MVLEILHPFCLTIGVTGMQRGGLGAGAAQHRAPSCYSAPAASCVALQVMKGMFASTTGKIDDRWRAFMELQIKRAREMFAAAESGINLLDKDARWPVWCAPGSLCLRLPGTLLSRPAGLWRARRLWRACRCSAPVPYAGCACLVPAA